MTIEELLAQLNIDDDKKAEAEKTVKAFLNGQYVPKSRFNEVNEEKNTLKKTVTERDGQLEELKKASGNSEELKKQIETLQESNKKSVADYEEQLKTLRLSTAIKLALTDAQDVDIVESLIKKDKLVYNEDGKVVGLDEQIKSLRTEKPFLFKTKGKSNGYTPNGGKVITNNPFAKDTFNLTEQGRLFRDNPEEARRLASAAGVKL